MAIKARHWKHYLTGKRFSLKTDQKSVSYMFDQRHEGKIKRWRVELSCYCFDIVYRPGKENIPPDTFSRSTCAALPNNLLYQLHRSLSSWCYPNVSFVRVRNSIEEIKRMTNSC